MGETDDAMWTNFVKEDSETFESSRKVLRVRTRQDGVDGKDCGFSVLCCALGFQAHLARDMILKCLHKYWATVPSEQISPQVGALG